MGRKGTLKVNALRSGVVVLGSLAFGYLTLQLGFKPFLERAQLEAEQPPSSASSASEQPPPPPPPPPNSISSSRHF